MRRLHLLDRLIGPQWPDLSSAEAVAAFESPPYASRMAARSTWEALRLGAADDPERPALRLLANADPDDAKRYLEIGMAAVVEKPIKPERLRAAINTALSGAEAEAPAQTQPARRNKRVA